MTTLNNETKYDKILIELFQAKLADCGDKDIIYFDKDDVAKVANDLNITIRNIPDIIYTYRSRRPLPMIILDKGNWIIAPKGKGKFAFCKISRSPHLQIQEGLASIDILNSLPEIVEKYSTNDEQALLSCIRYNRLIDVFTGITCFHLQSHIRTTIREEGQVEVDDLYVGVDTDGNEYIIPIEAKGPDARDMIGWVQISSLVKYARQYFSGITCCPIAVKPIDANKIYLIEFEDNPNFEEISIKNIKLYSLVRKSSHKNGLQRKLI